MVLTVLSVESVFVTSLTKPKSTTLTVSGAPPRSRSTMLAGFTCRCRKRCKAAAPGQRFSFCH